MRTRILAGVLGFGLLSMAAAAVAAPTASAAGFAQLHGTWRLTKGSCTGGRPAGSYLSVTYGTKAIRNSASSCADGSFTLLSPGSGSLLTGGFSPAPDDGFDSHGNATARTIAKPALFDRQDLGLVTAARNLQDDASGPPIFSAPHIYVSGTKAYADMRAVQVLYGGEPDTTCASASGAGCWLVGAERATGTYSPKTHRLTLSWFTGQSFVPTSAGTAFHLTGIFTGAVRSVHRGTTVDLGTSSVVAGAPDAAEVADLTSRHHASGHGGRHRRHRAHRHHRHGSRQEAAASIGTAVRSPAALAAEALLVLNIVTFVAAARRKVRA